LIGVRGSSSAAATVAAIDTAANATIRKRIILPPATAVDDLIEPARS
jgi:hypothetical protein